VAEILSVMCTSVKKRGGWGEGLLSNKEPAGKFGYKDSKAGRSGFFIKEISLIRLGTIGFQGNFQGPVENKLCPE